MNTSPLFIAQSNCNDKFFQGDSFQLVNTLEDKSIQLVITSPPYNIGKEYEKKKSLELYLKPYAQLIKTLYNKLSDNGHICWEVGNFVDDGEIFPLDIYFYSLFKEAGFKLRNRIIWHFEHGLHASKRFSGRYETILWFSKTDNYLFNLDAVRIPSKYPGKLGFKGDKKGLPTGNPLGKNPSDYWNIVVDDWAKEIWDIPNVKSNHPEKTIHPCQFPIELVQRCVLALTSKNDVVLDPFMGVGSACLASIMHDRNFIGFELDQKYINIAKDRISKYHSGILKIRPLGKPVYQPTGKEKTVQIPAFWSNI